MLQAQRQFEDVTAWVDVAEIEVPAGTKRKTALLKAAEAWGATIPDEGLPVRLVPAEHAEISTLRPKPPAAPELEVV